MFKLDVAMATSFVVMECFSSKSRRRLTTVRKSLRNGSPAGRSCRYNPGDLPMLVNRQP